MRGRRCASGVTRMKRIGAALLVASLPLLPVLYSAGCVDGVTPNCADPAIQCGPDLDGSADRTEAALLPEASSPDTAEAAPDANDVDGDLDAGDEG